MTHQQLHALVTTLGDEIASVQQRLHAGHDSLDPGQLERIERRSNDLKVRLRSILQSLEQTELAAHVAPRICPPLTLGKQDQQA